MSRIGAVRLPFQCIAQWRLNVFNRIYKCLETVRTQRTAYKETTAAISLFKFNASPSCSRVFFVSNVRLILLLSFVSCSRGFFKVTLMQLFRWIICWNESIDNLNIKLYFDVTATILAGIFEFGNLINMKIICCT